MHADEAAPGDFPYDGRPDYTNWRRAVAPVPPARLDPFAPPKFRLDRNQRIASAGSCFARHIAQNLQRGGFSYFVTEPGSEYSARFGNIYTTLQLRQLLERAYGRFTPADQDWRMGERYVDALRPRVVAGGFADAAALAADRAAHLAAVRRMFEELDVLVFTLGLTEGWCSRLDGTAYPACPGKDVGTFEPAKYEFRNLGIAENLAHLEAFIDALHRVNPRARVLLTVSPVPLVATMEDRHVIQSTLYSKAVLRVAAEEVRRKYAAVDYFWSYEIITATFNAERYFEPDRRSVNAAGVAHVMRSFFEHFTADAGLPPAQAPPAADPCDEDVLDALLAKEFG